MNCKEAESLLSAYLENDLESETQKLVQTHVQSCFHCRQLKERMETVLSRLTELEEEVPFYLKNRLYNIADQVFQEKKPLLFFPKWIAAAIGTIILFLNLFYFTNIYPPANRQVHTFVSKIERLVGRTGGWFEKIKESKDLLFFTFFNKKSLEVKSERDKRG